MCGLFIPCLPQYHLGSLLKCRFSLQTSWIRIWGAEPGNLHFMGFLCGLRAHWYLRPRTAALIGCALGILTGSSRTHLTSKPSSIPVGGKCAWEGFVASQIVLVCLAPVQRNSRSSYQVQLWLQLLPGWATFHKRNKATSDCTNRLSSPLLWKAQEETDPLDQSSSRDLQVL